jgi:beta-lactamase regulating signal transducer with metallopeptidase domain
MGIRLILPAEFSFTKVINSTEVMPKMKNIMTSPILSVSEGYSLGLSKIFYLIWLLGALITLAILCKEYCTICYKLRFINSVDSNNLNRPLNRAMDKLNLKNKPNIVQNKGVAAPAEIGFFKQTIFVNEYCYTEEELYYIFLHELTHYKIKTNWMKLFTTILTSVFWWNPIMYWFRNHIDDLMEIYVDSYIAKKLNVREKSAYLDCLYRVSSIVSFTTVPKSHMMHSMAKSCKNNLLLKRFEAITSKTKVNIPMCVLLVVLLACYLKYAGSYVIQPYILPPPEEEEDITGINEDNAYIVEENGKYVLYYNGEVIGASDNYELLEKTIKGGN